MAPPIRPTEEEVAEDKEYLSEEGNGDDRDFYAAENAV